MRDRVRFSHEHQGIEDIAAHHRDTANGLRMYYGPDGDDGGTRFVGYDPPRMMAELSARLEELDRTSSLSLLSALEAAIRIDYLQRCYRRGRDRLSRALRDLHRAKGAMASLEDEILTAWQEDRPDLKMDLGDLKGALRYRHWLAHGRYWVPKLGRTYDFETIYELVQALLAELPLEGSGE